MATDKKQKSPTYRAICILAAAALVLIGVVMTPPEGLSVEGLRAICILLAAAVLWVTEALPVAITCLLLLPGFTYLGVMKPSEFYAAASSSSFFFILAGFGVGAALMNTNVSTVLLSFILKSAGNDSKKIIRGFILLTAAISLIVSNSTAVVAVVGLAVAVIKAIGNPTPGTSRLAKGLMLGLPFGALCGGLASPASNSLNVVLTDLLFTLTGVEVRFLQWMMIGVPLTILMTLFVSWWLPKHIDPEPLTDEQTEEFKKMFEKIPEKLEPKDWKFIIIVVTMIVLWVAGNWVKELDTTRVALLGVTLMFLPGINLMTGKDFMKNVQPLSLILLSCIMPLATAMRTSGAGQWLVDTLFAGAAGWPAFVMLLMITLVALIIHLAVPSGSSNAALSGTLMFSAAVSAGIPGATVLLILATQCGNNFLLPIEGIYLFTFGYDHYTFSDQFKAGLPITVFQYILCVALVPVLALLFGLP